jgi:CubicO group peptidase (beta-lactamase class C family)
MPRSPLPSRLRALRSRFLTLRHLGTLVLGPVSRRGAETRSTKPHDATTFSIMLALEPSIDDVAARHDFSGVVAVDLRGDIEFAKAYGLADRRHRIANTVDTRFAIASGAKGFTALAVMRLVEDGRLGLDTLVRSVLGDDLPLIDDRVTIEQLLAHRSGIGDYLDEDAIADIAEYVMPVPVHRLASSDDYLAILDGFATVFEPDERFAYNNAGFVVLAIIAERVSGIPFHELVVQRICRPAGMDDTEYLRSDELPARAALGYLGTDRPRTNVLHLPVLGSGDGGIYTTAADVSAFWTALFDGRIVSSQLVAEMVNPRSQVDDESKRRYGLGFWLDAESDLVMLEGYDAGVSFLSDHDPHTGRTQTVISNTSEGAWSVVELLDERTRVG